MSVIQDQLKKVLVADLSNFDEKTNTFFIKKYEHTKFEVGKYYLIRLDNTLMNRDNEIMCNWNNSEIPEHNIFKVEIIKEMGKLIYVQGVSYDEEKGNTGEIWSGWLPTDEIKLLEGF